MAFTYDDLMHLPPGKVRITETGPSPSLAADGIGKATKIYNATDGSGAWIKITAAQKDDLVRNGATITNPEAEELAEQADAFAG